MAQCSSVRLAGHPLTKLTITKQGRRQKIFQGATEKRPKISKKYRKLALFASFRGGGGKKAKNSTFKLYLQYLYRV